MNEPRYNIIDSVTTLSISSREVDYQRNNSTINMSWVLRDFTDMCTREMVKEEPLSDCEDQNTVCKKQQVPVLIPKQEITEEEATKDTYGAHSTWQEGREELTASCISPALLEPIVTISDGEVPSTSNQHCDDPEKEKEEVAERVRSGEYVLLRKERSRSKVWEKFSSVYDCATQKYVGYVQCSNCSCLISMKLGSGTTHLTRHVCNSADNNRGNILSTRCVKSEDLNGVVEKCVDFCVRDVLPSSVVSREGFRKLGQELIKIGSIYGNIKVEAVLPPPRLIFKNVSNIASQIRQTVMPNVIDAVKCGMCAMELWAVNLSDTHYVAVTSQLINNNWKIQRQLMAVTQCYDKEYSNILMQENINSEDLKKLAIVINQSHTMNQSKSEINFLQCASYSLTSVIKKTFDDETFMQENCPDLLQCWRTGKRILKFLESLDNVILIPIKRPVLPRWNSLIAVLETVHNNYEYIVHLLNKRNESHDWINSWNRQLVFEIITFLLKFKEVMVELQKNSYPTLHLVLVFFYELYGHCLPCTSDHSETALLKNRIGTDLKQIQFAKEHYVATFLCPNTRLLKLLEPDIKKKVHEDVIKIFSGLNAKQGAKSPESPPSKKSRFGLWSQQEEDGGSISDEIMLYLATGRQESEEPSDFLSWWEREANIFPRLAQVARKVLCIPATCTSHEKLFNLGEHSDFPTYEMSEILFARKIMV